MAATKRETDEQVISIDDDLFTARAYLRRAAKTAERSDDYYMLSIANTISRLYETTADLWAKVYDHKQVITHMESTEIFDFA